MNPLRFDFLAELFGAALLDQNLDARLVDVVAPAVAVVDPEDRFARRSAGAARAGIRG